MNPSLGLILSRGGRRLVVIPDPPAAPTISITNGATASVEDGSTLHLSVSTTGSPAPSVAYSSSNEAVATVSSSGLVTAVTEGTATITATAVNSEGSAQDTIDVNVEAVGSNPTIEYGADEPQPDAAGSTLMVDDDWSDYASTSELYTAFGGPWVTDPPHSGSNGQHHHAVDHTRGYDGTVQGSALLSSLRYDWPEFDSPTQLDCPLNRINLNWGSGRTIELFEVPYFCGINEMGAGKKFFLIWPADASEPRWTINESVFSLGNILQTGYGQGGWFDWYPGINSGPEDTPQPGDQAAWASTYILGSNRWHRYLAGRLPESTVGAGDGQLHLWWNGFHVVNRLNVATGVSRASYLQLASTFNGPTTGAGTQSEWYGRIRIFRRTALP